MSDRVSNFLKAVLIGVTCAFVGAIAGTTVTIIVFQAIFGQRLTRNEADVAKHDTQLSVQNAALNTLRLDYVNDVNVTKLAVVRIETKLDNIIKDQQAQSHDPSHPFLALLGVPR